MIVAFALVASLLVGLGLSFLFLGGLQTLLILTAFILGSTLGLIVPLVLVQLPGIGERVAAMLRASAAATLYRPTLTFGDSTDLLLRRRTWSNELGREVVAGGDDDVVIDNPASAIWPWHGQPLTIVDELFGVAFDPRHAAAGEPLRQHILDGTLLLGSLREWMRGAKAMAVPAYSEVPRQATRVVLEGARPLLWGAEEGDHPAYAEELFKKSQAGRVDVSGARQFLLPFGALLLTYGLMWVGGQWGPSGNGGGGGIVPIGGALWLLLGGAGGVRSVLKKLVGLVVVVALGGGFAAATYGLYLLFGPVVAIIMALSFLFGASLFPFGGFLIWWRFPKSLAELVAGYYLRFGLIPYDDPVFELSTTGYDVVEGADGSIGGDERYRLETRWVGFSIAPDSLEELFDGLYETPREIEARKPAAVTDGGVAEAPPGYVASPGLEVEGVQGFIPTDLDENTLYVRTDRAMSPFRTAQQGGRVYKSVEVAKEKYGAGWKPLGERWIYILTIVGGICGLLFGYLSFHA